MSVFTSVTAVFPSCFSEMWFVSADKWHGVRGGQMILVMKVVSVGLDVSGAVAGGASGGGGGGVGSRPPPGPLQFAGYILHPGTTVFGPWIALDDYINSMESCPLKVGRE